MKILQDTIYTAIITGEPIFFATERSITKCESALKLASTSDSSKVVLLIGTLAYPVSAKTDNAWMHGCGGVFFTSESEALAYAREAFIMTIKAMNLQLFQDYPIELA